MPKPSDDEREREERARRLEEEIAKLGETPPKSPHEFIQEKMRELEKGKKKKRARE